MEFRQVGKSEGSGTTQLERNCSARRMPKVIVVLSFPLDRNLAPVKKVFLPKLALSGDRTKDGTLQYGVAYSSSCFGSHKFGAGPGP
jgi:hypothetical protein